MTTCHPARTNGSVARRRSRGRGGRCGTNGSHNLIRPAVRPAHPAAAGYRLSKTRRALTSASDRWPHKLRGATGSILRPPRYANQKQWSAASTRRTAVATAGFSGVCADHECTETCGSWPLSLYCGRDSRFVSRAASAWIAGTVAGLPGWDLYVLRCPQLRSGDMPSDLVGAVVQALEQQRRPASGSAIPPVVQIVGPTRGNLHGGRRLPEIGDPGRDSLIKARYASTVLRVAQTVDDQQTAARL